MTETVQEFYVAPDGNDSNPGTKQQPFRTIGWARDAVREVNKEMTSDIVVYIRQGQYELSEPLVFTSRDSAKDGYQIIYQAYQDEEPLISGGRKIENWQRNERGLFTAESGALSFRQFYVNGKKAVRARLPETGHYFRLNTWDKQRQIIKVRTSDLQGFGNLKNAEMVVQLVWTVAVLRIKSFQKRDDEIELSFEEAESRLVFPRFHPPSWPNQVYHLENSLEFLTDKNEWYLDKDKGVLYYLPEDDSPASSDTVVPVLESLLRLEGTLDQPVSGLRFEGLTFAYTGWTRPDDYGHLPLQAGMVSLSASGDNIGYVGRPPAAVHVSNAHHVHFARNRFINLGATALDLESGVQECTVSGNLFKEIAGSAILIGIFSKEDQEVHLPYIPQDEREICRDNTIQNNRVTEAAQEDYGCVGIGYGYTEATTIQHNEVCYLPWTGIHCGWGWTTKHSAARNNIIRYNHVHHIMELLVDGAAIYTLSCQPGTLIENNYLHAIHKSEIAKWVPESDATGVYLDTPAIYVDEGSGEMTIRNNLIEDIDPQAEALHYNEVFRTKEEFVFRPNVYENNGSNAGIQIKEQAGLQADYTGVTRWP